MAAASAGITPFYFAYHNNIAYLTGAYLGLDWHNWIFSDGKEGTEPVDWVRDLFDHGLAMSKTADPDEYWTHYHKGIEINNENIAYISTVGGIDWIITHSPKLGNVPNNVTNHEVTGRGAYEIGAYAFFFKE